MIRTATVADAPALLALVVELAVFEKAPDAVTATATDVHAALSTGLAGAFVVEVDGAVIACALWFRTYSTWTGKAGIWLEDLYVQPAHRKAGWGRALMVRMAQLTVELGAPRLDWVALEWNATALAFYRALGASTMEDWVLHRLSGDALTALSQGDSLSRG